MMVAMPLKLTDAVDALSVQRPEVQNDRQEGAQDDVKYNKDKNKIHSLKGARRLQHKADHALPVPSPP
ncbi:hypothetical protein EUGRSUZ_F03498 [Eucalyptus grandis]|uniref:Uncharacterized protein n=2 Tax=Eucalyptus grandis TaxID=71139 RepID=A0ACC3KLT0_EUCGR|nr:hypothetical protein EUGRSUZ_F03498 [Eucalyptus grandis]